MIVRAIQGDVFASDAKHIAFAINSEGINDGGFSGAVYRNYWKELGFCGEHEIGAVLSKTVGDKTFHAMVCHSLDGHKGWGKNLPELIKECFDKIPANGEEIATIAIGTGYVGAAFDVDFKQIVCGMHDSEQNIIMYSKYTFEELMDFYNQEKGVTKKRSINQPNK